MKPFNYEEARAGKPVCTRDGREARIICWDRQNEYFPIVALIKAEDGEDTFYFTNRGSFYRDKEIDSFDLMMKTERHELWKVILMNEDTGDIFSNRGMDFESKEEAEKWAENYSEKDSLSVLDIVKLYEWED